MIRGGGSGVEVIHLSVVLWAQLWEKDDIAYGLLAEKHHAQPIDSHAHATSGGHSVFEGGDEILIQFLLLSTGLMFEGFSLLDGIILL